VVHKLGYGLVYRGIGDSLLAEGINLSVRFGVFTAVTMKNVVFWDIKTQFLFHRRHITSPLESSQLMLCKI
jgi:hypothetical protein